MSAEDLSAVPSYAQRKRFGGSSEDVRLRRLKERPENRRPEAERRAESWNRRQKRGASKERGGTQLPTWAETRTTRLRRSRALGETTAQQQQQQKPKRNGVGGAAKPEKAQQPKRNIRPPPPQHVDAEDEEEEEEEEDDAGRVLMERIRANSRCLKAQLSSHRRTVSDTGSANHETRQPVRPPNNSKASHGNGVYAMHRRTAGGSSGGDSGGGAEVESTSIRLLDENGEEVVTATSSAASSSSPAAESPLASSAGEPEVVHQHVLEVDSEDGTKQHGDHDGLSNISEKTGRETPTDKADSPVSSNDLEEGRLVNQNGQLTIEVEVKEMTSSDGGDTTLESNITPEFDSYRVYSDQNILRQSEDPPVDSAAPARASRADVASRNEAARLNRAKQARGVYLRRMEHRNSQAGRTQSNDRVGQSPARRVGGRSVSQNRSGRARMEKWSTTAQSTGDLREAAWDYSNDQDRLLTILSEVRGETRIRQRQREELLRKIKQLQSRAHQRREQGETSCLRNMPKFAARADSAAVREMWRKRYLEAKKVTPRLEEECSRLRQELEKLHRELLAKVQAGVWALLTISGKTERPSNKLSYKIMIARLLQEIEDLTRRVEGTRLKLHTEVKLRSMAEKDVRNLREELLKKKIQVTLTRNQEQAAMGNGLRQQYFISAV